MLKLLISMGGSSVGKELVGYFQYDATRIVTTAAFVQQRAKILPSALEWLFRQLTQESAQSKLYKGYRILAIDGSDLHTPITPMIKKPTSNTQGKKDSICSI